MLRYIMSIKLPVMKLFIALAVLAAGLNAASVFAAEIIVPTNAVWKYLDTGTNLGTAWVSNKII